MLELNNGYKSDQLEADTLFIEISIYQNLLSSFYDKNSKIELNDFQVAIQSLDCCLFYNASSSSEFDLKKLKTEQYVQYNIVVF